MVALAALAAPRRGTGTREVARSLRSLLPPTHAALVAPRRGMGTCQVARSLRSLLPPAHAALAAPRRGMGTCEVARSLPSLLPPSLALRVLAAGDGGDDAHDLAVANRRVEVLEE